MTVRDQPIPGARSREVSEVDAPLTLQIEDLSIRLKTATAKRPILDGVCLSVAPGETVGLVGESGSGKSVTSRAALGMLPEGATVSGSVRVNGADVLGAGRAELTALRRHAAAMIFQDPRAGINPVRRIEDFLAETMRLAGLRRGEIRARCLVLLESAGIRDPRRVLRLYPDQLSGGMLQRVMIASALAADPALLLADEPTTALDVTIQAEVIGLLQSRRERVGAAMLFVTHDLELAAAICDRIYVMYAGRIVEERGARELFAAPAHPYTRALLEATPKLESDAPVRAIAGRPLSLAEAPPGCAFAPRCPVAFDRCVERVPPLVAAGGGRAACLRCGEGAGESDDRGAGDG